MDGEGFWAALDELAAQSEVVIDRSKGSRHPRLSDVIYPLDYGYLAGTASMDGGRIDVWLGTRGDWVIDGVLCIVDLGKRDSETKLLMGCTEAEKETAYKFHNGNPSMKGSLIRRG